jgi:hypothetical protein
MIMTSLHHLEDIIVYSKKLPTSKYYINFNQILELLNDCNNFRTMISRSTLVFINKELILIEYDYEIVKQLASKKISDRKRANCKIDTFIIKSAFTIFPMLNYLSSLDTFLVVPIDKIPNEFHEVVSDVMTNENCFSCNRPASFCFIIAGNNEKWYCGYCAAYIAISYNKNEIEIVRNNLETLSINKCQS